MSLLAELNETTDSSYDVVPQEDDELSNNSSHKRQEKRASLAALDLPISNNISSIEKCQTLPIVVSKKSTDINISIEEEEEKKVPGDGDIPHGLLDRAHSLDSGFALMARQPSIEILTTEDDAGNLIKEEIVVPPHNILVKMPFYTTPLTLEATNNAFRDFSVRLYDMGFKEQAEAALVCTAAESVEAAVDFIMNNTDSLYHRFIPNIDNKNILTAGQQQPPLSSTLTPEAESSALKGIVITDDMLCGGCSLPYREHLIDHHGEEIVHHTKYGMHIEFEEDGLIADHPQWFGDLGGRVSMSIATRNVREQQKTLQEIIEQRMHAIAEGTVDDIIAKHISLVGEPDHKSAGSALQLVETLPDDYDGPTQICMVCFDEKPVYDFFDAPCKHNYCAYCLRMHYRIKTKDGDVLKVSCIDPECEREITEQEILRFLENEPEMIDKFLKFKKQKLIMLNPNARFCFKPNCNGYMIGSRWNPKLVCPDCSARVCYNCGQPWHGYFVGCNQNVDIGYARWALNKDVQRCPKCRVRIEKAEGCNHMTCQSCKYQFCWICRGQYNGSHFEWYNIFGCPGAQYTPRFCRCPTCFPRWLNRLLIIICFLAIVVPIIIVAGIFWLLIICLVFCIRCEFKLDVCDCF